MSKNTLQEIVENRRALDEILADCGGEITDASVEEITGRWMEEITKDLAAKSDGYQYRMKDMQAMEAQFKEMETMYRNARKSLERVEESLKTRMKLAMQAMGVNELAGNQFKYKLSDSAPSVEIVDESQLPAKFCREKVILEVDKTAVKEHVLSTGEEIPGAILTRGKTLRVSIVKESKK
jgi:Siphovirus Gp157